MSKSRVKTGSGGAVTATADPLLLSVDLEAWVGSGLARAGRRDALLGRVEQLRLAVDGRSLEAGVRGGRSTPYSVEVRVTEQGLQSRCTCARETQPACRHAVAALEALRFPAAWRRTETAATRRRASRGSGRITRPVALRSGFALLGGPPGARTRDERLAEARREALDSWRQRSRRPELQVTETTVDGGWPTFLVAERGSEECWRVSLHGEKARRGNCECTEYAAGELGTCPHVERAVRWYSRKKKRLPSQGLALWWWPRPWVDRVPDPLQEIRLDAAPSVDVRQALLPWFDEQGWLRASRPGRARSDWAREAIAQARTLAERCGARWNLDSLAARVVEIEASRERLSSRLAQIDSASAAWKSILPGLRMRLHPFQEIGALFLARRGRAMLADEMGLGKTAQAIVAALLLRRVDDARRVLVVCPASLKYQWRRELEKVCGESALVAEGPPPARQATYARWNAGFLIVNYELVLRDLESFRSQADLVVLDEAQRIKNWSTKTARAVKRLESRHAFILTGTPLENRLLELHSLMEFLHPRALGPRWRLLPLHAMTDVDGRIVGYEGLEIMRARLRGFLLRRQRRAVADELPQRTDNLFWTSMTPAQLGPYRKHASTVARLIAREQALLPGEVRLLLRSLTRMRILCNARALYDWERTAQRLRDPQPPSRAEIKALGSPKLEEFARVLDDLLEDDEPKFVVYSQWERMLRLTHFVVRAMLARRGLRAAVFHGGLSAKARDEMVQAFHHEPELRVLFSTDAGGLGLNLQHAASNVIHLEVPWNPAVLEQRVGRVHRMGQRRSVQVLHFITRGAIEERVRRIVESKQALFEGLLGGRVDRVLFDETQRKSFLRRVHDLVQSPGTSARAAE